MIKSVVRLAVHLTANEGKLDDFHRIAKAMTEASKAEAGTLGYEWFSHADGKSFRLLETYTDTAALEAHFDGPAVREWVPKLMEFGTLNSFEIYGDPGPKVSQMAAGLGAAFFKYDGGIDR